MNTLLVTTATDSMDWMRSTSTSTYGYKQLTNYRRVQAAFSKCKSICKLSRQSSHFKYARITVANDTRWNSHFRLHLKHVDEINEALNKECQSALCLSTADKEILSRIIEVMCYFSEATDILQTERN